MLPYVGGMPQQRSEALVGEIAGGSADAFSLDGAWIAEESSPGRFDRNRELGAEMGDEGKPGLGGFDEGWLVSGLGSDPNPTVAGGDADVLYLLPKGAIELVGT